MSGVFDAYATYYDLLYRDKDYAGEAAWVASLIERYRPGARRILEFGSGTGAHAAQFAQQGYAVSGIDLSPAMVERARGRTLGLGVSITPRFDVGDIRTYRSEEPFEVVLALFHVMSYQTGNADLRAAIHTAAANLEPGGLLIFDCWYGPGVLSEPPTTRVRRIEGNGVAVTRIAEPLHVPDQNRVDVNYEVLVRHGERVQRILERHALRYLFTPEVDLLLEGSGLGRIAHFKWMSDEAPDASAWNACFVVQAKPA